MALLEVRDLTLEYATDRGPLRAVDGISLELEAGRGLGVIGESGSGKTSLAITLMRLLPRNATLVAGSIHLGGEDITALGDEAFRQQVRWSRMAMVFQGAMHSLNPVIRVGDQVGERLRVDGMSTGDARERVRELLSRVGLSAGIAQRYPHELSGGMKQRVMIATALTHDPPLLILDEPTSALDVSIQAQIMNLLKELKAERRIAMLFITHDLALASDLCDDIAVVYAGQVRELGTADAVLTNPLDPYSQRLLASIPNLHDDRPPDFLPGAPPDLRDDISGCRFAPRCPLVYEPCGMPPPLIEALPGRWARCWLHHPELGVPGAASDPRASVRIDTRNEAPAAGAPSSTPAVTPDAATLRAGADPRPLSADTAATEAATPEAGTDPSRPALDPDGVPAYRAGTWTSVQGPILRLEDVGVDFYVRTSFFATRAIHAVIDVSLDVAKGETLALVGESGSGKTTLGRATLHLVPITSGRVVFEGGDVSELRGRDLMSFRQRAQAIFQDPFSSLSPYMRVGELVAEPLVIHGPTSRSERDARILAALEQVKLSPAAEFAEKYPHTLSGGQRQRVSIARAMVLQPDYLVADEPVSMIDASSRAEILFLLSELQERHELTFLYITHDLASARHFADRIAVMYAGRVVELASAAELVEHALHPYTQALLAAVPEPDPANRRRERAVVGGEPPDPGALPTGCAFHPRCPAAMPGICDVQVPPLIEDSAGHLVACHLYPAGSSEAAGVAGSAVAGAGEPVAVGSGVGERAAEASGPGGDGAADAGGAAARGDAGARDGSGAPGAEGSGEPGGDGTGDPGSGDGDAAAAAAAARSASITSRAASRPGSSASG